MRRRGCAADLDALIDTCFNRFKRAPIHRLFPNPKIKGDHGNAERGTTAYFSPTIQAKTIPPKANETDAGLLISVGLTQPREPPSPLTRPLEAPPFRLSFMWLAVLTSSECSVPESHFFI